MPPEPSPRRLCLVTGASAGIGAAFARVYASHGYDLALVARRRERLEAVAEEIRKAHGVEALVIPADLAAPGAAAQVMAEVAARGRGVSALVNNAGFGLHATYGAAEWGRHAAMLQLMLTAVCELTRLALPAMLDARFGRIVNVASLAGLIPGSPGASLYGPIKSFLVKFSQGLHVETLGAGVHVTALCPGFTHTEFHDVNQTRRRLDKVLPGWMWQGSDEVAAAGYAAAEANRAVCVTGGPNKAIAALVKLMPDDWTLALMARQGGRITR